jgi:hypothetical protein
LQQLPFLQQQQLTQLWWLVQSATKQLRSIEENNSRGAQPHAMLASGKSSTTRINAARISQPPPENTSGVNDWPRRRVEYHRRATCCAVRNSVQSHERRCQQSPLIRARNKPFCRIHQQSLA